MRSLQESHAHKHTCSNTHRATSIRTKEIPKLANNNCANEFNYSDDYHQFQVVACATCIT